MEHTPIALIPVQARRISMRTRINRNVLFTLVSISLIGLLPSTFTATDSQSSQSANETMLSIEDKTEGMRKMEGFFPMYWDDKNGKIWLEISRFDTENSLCSGAIGRVGLQRYWTRPRAIGRHPYCFPSSVLALKF